MTSDQDIKGLLTIATGDEPPPTAGPTDVFRGARTIQRRRLVSGLAGAGVLGVALTVGVLVATSGHPGGRDTGAAPAGPGTTRVAAAPSPSAVDPLETLRGLLPGQMKTSDERSDGGFAGLVLIDGAGRTAVEVNVQPGFPAGAGKAGGARLLDRYDCAKRADPAGTRCVASILPDQTRIVGIDGPAGESDPGVLRRQVDALGADGLRVVVTAWNAAEPRHGPATRQSPALDGDQLRRIATSQRWRTAPTGESTRAGGSSGGGRVN
ncbi:hypothetical protein [Micromonospora sp. WMMD980]|uniref:hypothetical protein n=1 Tax=Micromonospora sp. WMMD980 TaxID=3016088 RepID=UPI00241689D2|nr:hypothetical protein [Micromonospora sp. WMMD980]MDG4802540.1 hypothetical protein [Micromonospora sp. WMMD980]